MQEPKDSFSNNEEEEEKWPDNATMHMIGA